MSQPSDKSPESQVQHLQEQVAFQQRTIDQLHAEMLAQQAELASIKADVGQLTAMLRRMMDEGWGEDLPHEKPPHY